MNSLSSDRAVCAWIPLFALRAEECRRPELGGKPTAILSPHDTRKLWLVSSHARRFGVRPGQTVSQAIGLCAALVLLEADPVYYDEQFSRLLVALGNVSPVIEPAELGRVYVGVDGLERLYGTPEQQLHVIKATIDGLMSNRGGRRSGRRRWRKSDKRTQRSGENRALHRSLPPSTTSHPWSGLRLGWARGKFAAWAAAKRAKPGEPVAVYDDQRLAFLQSQSVSTLPIGVDTHRRLWQLGVKTLGALAALPEEAVTSQFGREGRLAWRLAAGRIIEPVTGRETPEPIIASVDFPVPFADMLLLEHAIEKLVERAMRHPRRTGWRVHGVRLHAALEHGASWLVDANLKDPSASPTNVAAPLKVRLGQSPPTGAVENLTVKFTRFVPGTTELQLFNRDAASAARAGRQRALRWATQEIKTRLKRTMLHHIIEVHPWSRLPERRYALIDFDP